ncbi:MAG TPA: serine protease [bacterium (Candidatus Stahlbacteria)]|nr:serine protease [Candidatus Stahlbacteria bacterium]
MIYLNLFVLVLVGFGPDSLADEATTGRKILAEYQDAIITARIVVRYQMETGGREMVRNENVNEAIATVIDPSGLAILSLSNTDPTSLFPEFGFGGEDIPKHSWESYVSDITMITGDGQEIPARVLLRDKDLDLAFIRPREREERRFVAIDLTQDTRPAIMDKILILTRLGRVGDRAPYISLNRIQARVDKPRTFYVSGLANVDNGLGAPVFSLDGKVVGIILLRILKTKQPMFGGMFGGMSSMGVLPMILPAEEILKVAKQARDIK